MTVLAICLASAARPVRWPGPGGVAGALPGGVAGALPAGGPPGGGGACSGCSPWPGGPGGACWLLALARR